MYEIKKQRERKRKKITERTNGCALRYVLFQFTFFGLCMSIQTALSRHFVCLLDRYMTQLDF
jgi:hypothetical protein